MKGRLMILVAAAMVFSIHPAWGDYQTLKQEVENYSPPDVFRPPQRLRSSQPGGKPDAAATAAAVMRTLRQRWEKALHAADQKYGPMTIDPAVIAAAADDAATLRLLQPRFSLPLVQSLTLLRNPAVNAAAERLWAALEGFDQVTQLNAVLHQYAAYTEGLMPGVGPMPGSDAIELQFPFPGVTALKGQVAEKNIEIEQQTLDLVRRDLMARVGKAYWNLHYTHQALLTTQEMIERLNHLESVAVTRYAAGKTSYQDVIKVRIDRERQMEQLKTLQEQRANLKVELLSLMDLKTHQLNGRPADAAPPRSQPPLSGLYGLALEKRQELKRLRAMIGRMERMIEMAATMIRPPVGRNASLYRDQAVLQVGSAAMQPTFAAQGGPTRAAGLPQHAWFGIQDAYLRQTRRRLNALRADLADAESRTRLMIRSAWFKLDRALRERSLYADRLLELSESALEVSTRGYELGAVSFADVIGAYNQWLDVSLAGRRRSSDIGIARAELAQGLGIPVP